MEGTRAGTAAAALAGATAPDSKGKLVILCIHGFRQNGRQFQGRLAALQKKLADVATFIFIDAPYVLPLWYKPTAEEWQQQQPQLQQQRQPQEVPAPKRAWLLSSELLAAQPELQMMFQQHHHNQQSASNAHSNEQVAQDSALVQPPMSAARASAVWQVAPADVATPEQHTRQCMGWQQSWHTIQQALKSREQQIDGLLGFSQGSAVVATVAALLQQQRQQQQQQQPAARSEAAASGVKFMILASGFVSPAPAHQELLQQQHPLQLPSLHVYAAAGIGSDRQIQQQLSDELYDCCHPATRQRILHDAGHLIPCRKDVIKDIKEFLQQFT